MPEPPAVPTPPSAPRHAAVARVRHDLLTPLNAVAGFLAIVGEDVAAAGRPELAERVRAMRADAAAIIAAIQALVHPDGELDADAVAAAVRARCVARAAAVVRGVAEVAEAADGPPTLSGDLRQVENGATALLALLDELPARLRAAVAADG